MYVCMYVCIIHPAISLSPASVDVVVEVSGGALAVALGAPAAAVGLVPHLVRPLQQALRLRRAVHALAPAQVLVEVLQRKQIASVAVAVGLGCRDTLGEECDVLSTAMT